MPASPGRRSCILTLAAVALLASPNVAGANAPAPDMYFTQVTSNTVEVCISSGTRRCPGGGDLIRQDPSTGEVVTLPEFCTSYGCYLDECVPEGAYRYGYVEPLECASPSGTYYFGEAEVTSPLGTCERSAGNPEPAAYSGALPWNDDPLECAGTYGDEESGDGGCSVSRSGSRAKLGVFLIQGLALLAGLLFLRKRTGSR